MKHGFANWYREEKKRRRRKRWLFKALNIPFPIERTIKKFDHFDQQIPTVGFSQAAQEFVDSLGIKLETRGLNNIRRGQSYLFIANHPTLVDPLATVAVLGQDDLKLVTGDNIAKLFVNIPKHLITVKNHQLENGKIRNKSFKDRVMLRLAKAACDPLIDYWDRKEVVVHNRRQIKKASQYLAKGGKLYISPIGMKVKPKLTHWRHGVGFILSQAMQQSNGQPIKVVFSYIHSDYPYLYQFWGSTRLKKKSRLAINFSEEIDAKKAFKDLVDDPKRLSRKLNKEYRQFVRKIKS